MWVQKGAEWLLWLTQRKAASSTLNFSESKQKQYQWHDTSSPSPFLVILVLCIGWTPCLYSSEHSGVSSMSQQVNPSFSNQSISPLLLQLQWLPSVQNLQSHPAGGWCFPHSFRGLCSASAFVLSITANNLVQPLMAAHHWICHAGCFPCSRLPNDSGQQYQVR